MNYHTKSPYFKSSVSNDNKEKTVQEILDKLLSAGYTAKKRKHAADTEDFILSIIRRITIPKDEVTKQVITKVRCWFGNNNLPYTLHLDNGNYVLVKKVKPFSGKGET